MPLAVSATTFRGLKFLDVDEAPHVGRELVEHVAALDAPVFGDRRDAAVDRRRGVGLDGHAADLAEAGVTPDRAGAGQAQLDAVVVGGVVRRREHRPGQVELARGEVEEVGRGQADVDHAEAGREHAGAEGPAELDAGLADVAAEDDPPVGQLLGEHERAEPDTDGVGHAGVRARRGRCPGCRRP